MLDSGNALFRNAAGGANEDDRKRAHFVLDVMGRLGTKAMAVGVKDLSAGLEFLFAEGKSSGVKLLSANLRRHGKPVFDASTVLKVGGLKVAVLGVSAPGPIIVNTPEVTAEGTVATVKDALGKLGKRDLTVLLAATSWADAMQLGESFKGQVDLVIQSGEFHGTIPPQRIEGSDTFVLASGQKGQSMGKLELGWGNGKGPVVDLSASERNRQQLELVKAQLGRIEARLKANHDEAQEASLKATVEQLRARATQLEKEIATGEASPGRSLKLDWIVLGPQVKDDEALKAEVLKIEPTYAGSH